jgi:hypothetical protein
MALTNEIHTHLVKTTLDFCDQNKIEFRDFLSDLVNDEDRLVRETTDTPFRFGWKWALESDDTVLTHLASSLELSESSERVQELLPDFTILIWKLLMLEFDETHNEHRMSSVMATYLQFYLDQSENTVTPKPVETSPEDWSTMANEIYRYKFLGDKKHTTVLIDRFNETQCSE